MPENPNQIQHGGNHYKTKIEHWDLVVTMELPYLIASAIKYLTRWKKKGGVLDLQKALHYVQKEVAICDEVPADINVEDYLAANDVDPKASQCIRNIIKYSRGVQDSEVLKRVEGVIQHMIDSERQTKPTQAEIVSATLSDPVVIEDHLQLYDIQQQVGDWSINNFGHEMTSKLTGQHLYDIAAFFGLVEELGELSGVMIRSHQGRGKYWKNGIPQTHEIRKDKIDAVADVSIFLCDFCRRNQIDLLAVVNETWKNVVSKRVANGDRAAWEGHSHEDKTYVKEAVDEAVQRHADKMREAGFEVQTGQGFAEHPEDYEFLSGDGVIP